MAALDKQLASLGAEARSVGTQPGPAACPKVCELAEAICSVAEKMCAIAARHPERNDMGGKCSGAKATCGRSRDDCAKTCPK